MQTEKIGRVFQTQKTCGTQILWTIRFWIKTFYRFSVTFFLQVLLKLAVHPKLRVFSQNAIRAFVHFFVKPKNCCTLSMNQTVPIHGMQNPFESKTLIYSTIVSKHEDEMNLMTDISTKDRSDQPFHGVMNIRRYANDDVFPYDTDSFLKAYALKRQDPYTREDLSHLSPYVAYKQMCWTEFSHVLTKDVTPAFQEQLARRGWSSVDWSNEARAFVDLATLERIGLIHSITADEAVALLTPCAEHTWLIRHTTQAWNMPHADVFSISRRVSRVVQHHRLVHVHGVGVYEWRFPTKPATFKEMFPNGAIPPPVAATPCDVIVKFPNRELLLLTSNGPNRR